MQGNPGFQTRDGMAISLAPGLLAGLKVFDIRGGLAGPLAGQSLADFGADVIKVERPG